MSEELKQAFLTGYILGHNDTVESSYCDPSERSDDLLKEFNLNTRAEGWVSVDKFLPEEEGVYLAYHKDWPLEIVSFYQGFFRSIGLSGDYPTHWQPITPPTE